MGVDVQEPEAGVAARVGGDGAERGRVVAAHQPDRLPRPMSPSTRSSTQRFTCSQARSTSAAARARSARPATSPPAAIDVRRPPPAPRDRGRTTCSGTSSMWMPASYGRPVSTSNRSTCRLADEDRLGAAGRAAAVRGRRLERHRHERRRRPPPRSVGGRRRRSRAGPRRKDRTPWWTSSAAGARGQGPTVFAFAGVAHLGQRARARVLLRVCACGAPRTSRGAAGRAASACASCGWRARTRRRPARRWSCRSRRRRGSSSCSPAPCPS